MERGPFADVFSIENGDFPASHVSLLECISDSPGMFYHLPSLKLTFSHLKMDGWNTTFLLGFGPFSGTFAVSFLKGGYLFSFVGRSLGFKFGSPTVQPPDGRRPQNQNLVNGRFSHGMFQPKRGR